MDKKKKIERLELEKFLSNESLKLLVYKISESETPDFETIINKKSISIEHSKLIHPDLQQVEKYIDNIIQKAKRRFEEKYFEDQLYVLVTFRKVKLNGGKIAEEKYVDEVFKLIEKIYLKNKEYAFDIETKEHREEKSEIIETLWVSNTKGFSHWQSFGAFIVKWIDINWLNNIIKKKEDNIKKYLKVFDENWLLLISNFGTEASVNRTDFIDFSTIETEFDKIFIYEYRADEITIVK